MGTRQTPDTPRRKATGSAIAEAIDRDADHALRTSAEPGPRPPRQPKAGKKAAAPARGETLPRLAPSADPSPDPSADRLRALMMASGHIAWTASAAGSVEDTTLWCAFTGQTPKAAAGWGWLKAVHPDDRACLRRVSKEAIAAGRAFDHEARVRRHDGLYRSILIRVAPVRGPDGDVHEWVGIGADVTEHKEREEARDAQSGETRAAQQQVTAILESISDGFCAVDARGRLTYVNAEVERALGRSRDELVGRNVWEALPDMVSTPLHAAYLRAARERTPVTVEVFYPPVDAWYEARIYPAEDGGVTAYITGVTERKRAEAERERLEAELAERAAELEAIFEAMADGVMVCDARGRITRTNRAWIEGLRRCADVLGLGADPAFAALPLDEQKRRLVIRDERGRVLSPEGWPAARALRGETLTGPAAMDEYFLGPDGRELRLSASAAPIRRDAAGQPAGAVAVLHDVTERRRLERHTHEALDAVLAMAEMLVRAPASDDDDDQPVAVGPTMRRLGELVRRMLGCERVSIVGLESGADRMQPLALLGAPAAEERQWSDAVLRSRLSRSLSPDQMAQLISGETAVIDAPQPIEGGPQPLGAARGLVAPMLVADQLLGLLTVDFGAAHDDYTAEERTLAGATARLGALVIERERLVRDREAAQEAELAQREVIRRMDEFLATASHDLRSPLAGIHLRVQLATRRARQLVHDLAHLRHELVPLGTRMLVDLEDADVAAGRIERLVKRLLDVARARTGTLDMRPEPIDLARVVREVVEEQRFAAAARAIAMQLTGTSPMTVVADADRIAQVVTNYLTNAIRYSPAGAPITVALGAESAAARVEVRDEGPGIPPDDQERIWARFARANGVKQARDHDTETGLGMGLYISREIVERHGGAVGVESAPGHGSTFWFTLPLATAD